MKPKSCSRRLFPELQQHMAEWSGCTQCDLSDSRTMSVFYRGSLPCTILFVGEAPDDSASTIGSPFDGPLGDTLDSVVPTGISFAATYLVACGPADSISSAHINACWNRLLSFISLSEARIICTLGKVADSQFLRNMGQVINKLNRRPSFVRVNHPFYIAKSKDVVLETNKAKVLLQGALDRLDK